MARAIDADALQELCNRRIQDTWNSGTAPVSWAEAYADFKDDIDSIPTLTPPNEPERAGLYGKYTVYKNKDGSLVTDCFILRPAKDPAAVAALRAYAAATDNAELAADIINWVGAEPNERVKVMEAINNAAVAYIEGGPYENDLPGMELALKIDRLSRDFVRPPEGEEDT